MAPDHEHPCFVLLKPVKPRSGEEKLLAQSFNFIPAQIRLSNARNNGFNVVLFQQGDHSGPIKIDVNN
jgi:hypothetical protein